MKVKRSLLGATIQLHEKEEKIIDKSEYKSEDSKGY